MVKVLHVIRSIGSESESNYALVYLKVTVSDISLLGYLVLSHRFIVY